MTDKQKESLRIFKRRYGHYFLGVFILLCVAAVMWIGYHPQFMASHSNKAAEAKEDDTLNFDDMDLGFEVTLAALDGESFIYSIYFDHDITTEEASEINWRINRLLESCPKETYPGYISPVDITGKNKAEIMLDLGNADTEAMIKGIPESLKGLEGIEKIIINEDIE